MFEKLWTWWRRAPNETIAEARAERLQQTDEDEYIKSLRTTSERGAHSSVQRAKTDEYVEHIKSLRTKAERGDRDAQLDVALALWKGFYDVETFASMPRSHEEALRWWHEAASHGDTRAQVNLAYLYCSGRNVPPAEESFEERIAKGERAEIPRKQEEGERWLRTTAEGGHVDAQFVLGWMHYSHAPSTLRQKDQVTAQIRKLELAEAAKWLQRAAESGHAEAQYLLALTLDATSSPDLAINANWYRKAADNGILHAQEALGDAYTGGIGVPQNLAEAARWYRAAAEQGAQQAEDAQIKLGYMYAVGETVPQNFAEAGRLFRMAAERDWWNEYNEHYYCRYEHSQNNAEAVAWLCQAADEGWAWAPILIEQMRKEAAKEATERRVRWPDRFWHESKEFGLSVVHEVPETTKKLWEIAEQGDVNAQICLGLIECSRRNNENESRAAGWFRRAADQGSAIANRFLGDLYDRGVGVPGDTEKAETHFRRAAELGEAGAQYKLGEIFYRAALNSPHHNEFSPTLSRDSFGAVLPGQILKPLREYIEAAEWYSKAAEQGRAQAQYKLAELYAEGQGVPEDQTRAAKLLRRAAESGYGKAQYKLAESYSHGRGVSKDCAKAAYWCRRAAEQRDRNAMSSLEFRYFDGEGVKQDGAEALYWHELNQMMQRTFF